MSRQVNYTIFFTVTTKTLGSKSSVTKSYALNINNKKTANLTVSFQNNNKYLFFK